MHDERAEMHLERATTVASRADGDRGEVSRHEREAHAHEERALAAQDRIEATRHRVAAEELDAALGAVGQTRRDEADERDRCARERDERIRERLARQQRHERMGLRRFLPGPGRTLYSPGMVGTASRWAPTAEEDLDREIDAIARALAERSPITSDALREVVGARYWGPGRFRQALNEAVEEGRARRLSRTTYGAGG